MRIKSIWIGKLAGANLVIYNTRPLLQNFNQRHDQAKRQERTPMPQTLL